MTKIVLRLDDDHRRELEALSPKKDVRDGLARAIAMGLTYNEQREKDAGGEKKSEATAKQGAHV